MQNEIFHIPLDPNMICQFTYSPPEEKLFSDALVLLDRHMIMILCTFNNYSKCKYNNFFL